jgi:hypothetical protein
MDAKQVRKFAALGVLSVVAAVVIYMQMRPSAEERAIQENFRNSQDQAAAQPAAGTATAQQQAASPSLQSQFQRANVEIEDLLAGVQRENFMYDDVRIQRNPMQPLVGSAAPVNFKMSDSKGSDEMLSERITQAIRNMKITGIIWDEVYPVAVVNDEIVYNGYVFQDTGIRVASIESTRIILQFDETEFPVELEEL